MRNTLHMIQRYHPEVTRVVEAKRDIIFQVTADDCKVSKRGKPEACALARAAQHSFAGAIIGISRAYLIEGHTAYRHLVPAHVRTELVAFDRARKFAPGSYQLKRPSPKATLAHLKKRKTNARGPGSHTATKKHRHITSGVRALPYVQ